MEGKRNKKPQQESQAPSIHKKIEELNTLQIIKALIIDKEVI